MEIIPWYPSNCILGENLSADDDTDADFVKNFKAFIKDNNMHPDQFCNTGKNRRSVMQGEG